MLLFDKIFVSRDGRPLFAPISSSILPGKILTLRGESGLGKTTLLNALIQPSENVILHGTISLDGEVIDPEIRLSAESQTIFQEPVLFPHLSIGANVGLPLGHLARLERRQRIEQLLRQVGLSGTTDGDPMALSRGQMMRVSIARALGANSKILLMDEPFSALDPMTRRAVKSLLFDAIQKHGSHGLLVTHTDDDQPEEGEIVCLTSCS